jgi:Putative peptidoglycan binding domain/D-alanyl-D-alanine carboxypeptidase
MAHTSWGTGFPNCERDKVITLSVSNVRLPVRREVAPVVALLVKQLEKARGKDFNSVGSFGFACRVIAGTNTPSNHSFGVAIDLDAPENPHLTAEVHAQPHPLRKTFPGGRVLRSTMPMEAEAIAEKLLFRWGGTFESKPDPMHFEFMGSVADAERLAKRVEKQIGDNLVRGDRGPGVKEAQRLLKAAGFDPGIVDGIFGENTERAVIAFKKANGLEAKGVVGATTWRRLR